MIALDGMLASRALHLQQKIHELPGEPRRLN